MVFTFCYTINLAYYAKNLHLNLIYYITIILSHNTCKSANKGIFIVHLIIGQLLKQCILIKDNIFRLKERLIIMKIRSKSVSENLF